MRQDEEHLDALEAELPALAGLAFAEARERVLASGQSVLATEGGIIFEIFPDGHRRLVKRIDAPVPVIKGSRFILR